MTEVIASPSSTTMAPSGASSHSIFSSDSPSTASGRWPRAPGMAGAAALQRDPGQRLRRVSRADQARSRRPDRGYSRRDDHRGVCRGRPGLDRHGEASALGAALHECVYQPMLELLDYLRANGFQTWIVSGGGVDFMRVFAEAVYGIPPAQVIGSSGKVQFELRNGRLVLVKLPELSSFDDKGGQAGQHPPACRPAADPGGRKLDGDLAMLQYTAGRDGRSLALIVDHDDAEHEYAYRVSPLGRLEAALVEAGQGLDRRQHERRLNRVFPPSAVLGTSIAPAGGLRGVTNVSPHMVGRTTQRNPMWLVPVSIGWACAPPAGSAGSNFGTGVGAALEHAARNGGRVPHIDALSFAAPWTARGRAAWGRRLMARAYQSAVHSQALPIMSNTP